MDSLLLIHQHYPWLLVGVVVVYSAIAGSFFTCATYRVSKGISLRKPASMCPSCGERLRAVDLVPVLSYVFFKGRCRMCSAPIPLRYLSIELVTIAWGVACYLIFGVSLLFVSALLAGWGLLFYTVCRVLYGVHTYKVLLFSIIWCCVFFFLLFT